MTAGYNDRTCTNGKGGIKSVMLFPLGNVTSANVDTNNDTVDTYLHKLRELLKCYNLDGDTDNSTKDFVF